MSTEVLKKRINWLCTALQTSKRDNERQQRAIADRDEQIQRLEAALAARDEQIGDLLAAQAPSPPELPIAVESGPFADYERELAAALPDWEQQYAIFAVQSSDFVYNKTLAFSALLFVPMAAESAALTPSLPSALYENGVRLNEVGDALCLPSFASVTGIVCVSQAWRRIDRTTLDKSWLMRVRDTLVEQMCAEIEELNDTEHAAIMHVFKQLFRTAIVEQKLKPRRWALQRALRFWSSASSSERTSLIDYLSRVPQRPATGSERCPSYAHNSLLYVRAETYAAAADNSLVKRAKELDVEILFFLDDADLRLAASSFQDCKFEQLEDRVLAKIVEWDRDEPAAKKQKPDGEKTYGCRECPARLDESRNPHFSLYHAALKDCNICTCKNMTVHVFNTHMRRHARRDEKIKCSACLRTFSTEEEKNDHTCAARDICSRCDTAYTHSVSVRHEQQCHVAEIGEHSAYARSHERTFDGDEKAHERASELLAEANREFAPDEKLAPAERRHNTYIWRVLQPDRATRAVENTYEKLARIGYCGYGKDDRVRTHRASAVKAANRLEQYGEEPGPRDRFFIEHLLEPPIATAAEYHIYENVSERKAQFGERCILTALRSAPHIVNGRHVYGSKLPEELKWSSDDVALVGALLLYNAVNDREF